MEKATQASLNTQVVLVGEFNPAILTPDWLAAKGLINSDDLDLCRDTIQAHGKSRLMVFQSKWFRLQALAQQLSLASLDGATPRVADLAAGILNLLPETPITEFGINFDAHYKVQDIDSYHRFGDFFVPKSPFLEAVPNVDGKKASAGLLHLTVAMDSRARELLVDSASLSSQKRISIEPSNAVSPGLFFVYNHHIVVNKLSTQKEHSSAVATADYVLHQWPEDFVDAQRVFANLLRLGLA